MTLFKNPIAISKNRNHLFDFLKLIGILMVIFDHCSQRWIPGIQETPFYNFIFVTQMPLFIFVSGYLFAKPRNSEGTFSGIAISFLRNAIALLVPFFTFPIIASLLEKGWNENLWALLLNAIKDPSTYSLWFLWALFWIKTAGYACKAISLAFYKKNKKIGRNATFVISFLFFIGLFAVIYFLTKGGFGTKFVFYYSIFFVFGYFASIYRLLELCFSNITKAILLSLSFFALVLVLKIRPTMIFDNETALNIAIRFIASILSIISCSLVASFLLKLRVFKAISLLGTLSLEFYITHILLFRTLLWNFSLESFYGTAQFFAFIGLYLLFILIALLFVLVLKTNILTDFFFYGKLPAFRENAGVLENKGKKTKVAGILACYLLTISFALGTLFILPERRSCGKYWFIDEENSKKELITLDVWSNATYSYFEKKGNRWEEVKNINVQKWKMNYQPTAYKEAEVDHKSEYQVALYDNDWAGYYAFFFVDGRLYSIKNTEEGGLTQKCFVKS